MYRDWKLGQWKGQTEKSLFVHCELITKRPTWVNIHRRENYRPVFVVELPELLKYEIANLELARKIVASSFSPIIIIVVVFVFNNESLMRLWYK